MKVIKVSTMGNMGNRMIQFMVARALQQRVPGARIMQIHLPEWGIQYPPPPAPLPRTEIVTDDIVDLDRLASALNNDRLDCVDIRTYGQQMANFLPPAAYQNLFSAPSPAIEPCGPEDLLCNIRQGDILDAHHPDYVLVPIDFYAELVEQTGLRPVFHGQLEDSPYMAALKRRFPAARYVPSQGAVPDFQFVRQARNIVPSVSSFAWLAAWLSQADRIFQPVLGVLHPLQCRSVNLLPLDDPRYAFFLFPFHYAVPVEEHAAAHASLRRMWRKMPPERLATLLQGAAKPAPLQPHPDVFDEDYYLNAYKDVAEAVAAGYFPSGWHHFSTYGFAEMRQPYRFPNAWYCRTYPVAAFELGQGDAADPMRHWLEMGNDRGYKTR